MFNCCSHGTLLHFSLQSSHLNICYYHQDLHPRRLHAGSRLTLQRTPQRPSYSPSLRVQGKTQVTLRWWFGIGSTLQRHPFSGLVDSAGELLHTPWRIPTSMATVLLSISTNTFYGFSWASNRIGHLNRTFGSSHSASSAYQKWPTGHSHSKSPAPIKRAGHLTHLKFENRLRSIRPQFL